MKSNIEQPNKSNHACSPPLSSSFASLPEDIVLNCLARISKRHYPKLTLVSKSFRSLILSTTLYKVRAQLKTQEESVYLGLQMSFQHHLTWFCLWIKSDHQTLTQEKSSGNILVPVPSAYSLGPPNVACQTVGSELYKFECKHSCSKSVMSRGVTGKWREAPSMNMARQEPLMCVLHGKIYVMGGCGANESANWAEVFDPKTQTWEPLADPGFKLRFSSYQKLVTMRGNIYVKAGFTNYVYLVKENKWEIFEGPMVESFCVIEDVSYSYAHKKCSWYDTKSREWRSIKGLTGLDAYSKIRTEIGSYGGKLVIFWDSPRLSGPLDLAKRIWCAVIVLDKSINGEVWGRIEWVDLVLTLPWIQSALARIHTCVVRTS